MTAALPEIRIGLTSQPGLVLNGHTSRDAADDPTRRGDLVRLLDSFPADDGTPGRMSTDRLRSALGLE